MNISVVSYCLNFLSAGNKNRKTIENKQATKHTKTVRSIELVGYIGVLLCLFDFILFVAGNLY